MRRTTTKIKVVRISGNNRVHPSKNPDNAFDNRQMFCILIALLCNAMLCGVLVKYAV